MRRIMLLILTLTILVVGCKKTKPPAIDVVAPIIPPIHQEQINDSLENGLGVPSLPPVEFIGKIEGIKDYQLGYPISVRTDKQGNIFVLDLYSTDGVIKKFNRYGEFIEKFLPLESPIYNRPIDFYIDDFGNIIIADILMGTVTLLSADGEEPKYYIPDFDDNEYFAPRSLAMDSLGNLYVLSEGQIVIFCKEGQIINIYDGWDMGWAEFGYFEGRYFMGPTQIKIDNNDNLYIVDTLENRVFRINSNGRIDFVLNNTHAEERFLEINDIAISKDGRIYISDVQTNNIYVFDSKGNYLYHFGGRGQRSGSFGNLLAGFFPTGPTRMTISDDGILLVVDSYNHRVQGFDLEGQFIFSFGDKDLDSMFLFPRSVFVDQRGNILISSGMTYLEDRVNFRLQSFALDGTLNLLIASGYQAGSFNDPWSVVADRWGNIYLLDSDIIQRFNSRGRFEYGFGGEGSLAGQVGIYDDFGMRLGPTGLALDRDGNVYLANTFNNRIDKYSPAGENIWNLIVNSPTDLKVVNGKIYVLSSSNKKITVFSFEGDIIQEFTGFYNSEQYFDFLGDSPSLPSIEVTTTGNIFLADYYNHQIIVLNDKGERLFAFGELGTKSGNFAFPRALFYDQNANILYVADTENHRVQMFKINF